MQGDSSLFREISKQRTVPPVSRYPETENRPPVSPCGSWFAEEDVDGGGGQAEEDEQAGDELLTLFSFL